MQKNHVQFYAWGLKNILKDGAYCVAREDDVAYFYPINDDIVGDEIMNKNDNKLIEKVTPTMEYQYALFAYTELRKFYDSIDEDFFWRRNKSIINKEAFEKLLKQKEEELKSMKKTSITDMTLKELNELISETLKDDKVIICFQSTTACDSYINSLFFDSCENMYGFDDDGNFYLDHDGGYFIIDKDDYSIAKVERPLFQQEGVQQIWNLKIASSCDLIGFLVAYKRVKEE